MRRFAYRPQGGRKSRVAGALLGLCLLLVGSILLLDARLRPTITTISAYQARVFATRAINDAVYSELSDENVRYDNLVQLTRGGSGEITALQTDVVALGRLQSRVTDAVLNRMEELGGQAVRIPMGTLSGLNILSGQGPEVTLRVVPGSSLHTQVENRFDSAGINQTRHQILLRFELTVVAILPGYTVTTDVATDFCVAETVIVGAVPETFAEIGEGIFAGS